MRYSPSRPLAEPKPFFLIPLKHTSRKDQLVSHESFSGLNGYLDLEVKVLSDFLYVGSGTILLNEQNQAYYAFARRDSTVVIPATGMKGAVRSILEAISGSCISQIAKREITVGKKEFCKIKKDQEMGSTLCPACRLFGTTGYMGRVHFTDAVPIGNLKTRTIKISDLWPPRQALGRKFYQAKTFRPQDNKAERNHRFVEVVSKGSVFATRLFFENTSTGEMSLLLRSLGVGFSEKKPDAPSYVVPIKIGGAKPRCLGAVRFTIKRIRHIPSVKEGIFCAMIGGGERLPIVETLQEWLRDESLLDDDAWLMFIKGAKPSNDFCPKELY